MQETFDRTRAGSDTLATDETFDLISSDKVDGTAVYNLEDERLGKIAHFMASVTGTFAMRCSIMAAFSGRGTNYPLPWEELTYASAAKTARQFWLRIPPSRFCCDRPPTVFCRARGAGSRGLYSARG